MFMNSSVNTDLDTLTTQCGTRMEELKIACEKKKLLELPNELLLTIAEEVDSEDRRRFSKTCSYLFNLIRRRNNLQRFHTLERVKSLDIREQIGRVKGRRGREFQMILFRNDEEVLSAIVLYQAYADKICSDIQTQVQEFCSRHRIPPVKTEFRVTAKERLRDATLEFLREALAYYMVERVVYYTEAEDFNLTFPVKLWNIHPCCSIVLLNRIYCPRISHENVCGFLVSSRLCRYGEPWALSNNNCLEFSIKEERMENMTQELFSARSGMLFEHLGTGIETAKRRNAFEFEEKMTSDGDRREVSLKIKKMDIQAREYFDFFEKKFVTHMLLNTIFVRFK